MTDGLVAVDLGEHILLLSKFSVSEGLVFKKRSTVIRGLVWKHDETETGGFDKARRVVISPSSGGRKERFSEQVRATMELEASQEAQRAQKERDAQRREREIAAAREAEEDARRRAEAEERNKREAEEAFWNSPEGMKVRAARMLADIERQKAVDAANIRILEQERIANIGRQIRQEERESQDDLIRKVRDL